MIIKLIMNQAAVVIDVNFKVLSKKSNTRKRDG